MSPGKKAADLTVGDLIDVAGLDKSVWMIRIGDAPDDRVARVGRPGVEGPFTRHSDGVLWLHTNQGTVEVADDTLFQVVGRLP